MRVRIALPVVLRAITILLGVGIIPAERTPASPRPPSSTTAEGDSLLPPAMPFDPNLPVQISRRRSIEPLGLGSTSSPGVGQLVPDGAWSWFGDPRALYAGDQMFIGWITSGGAVQVGSLDRTGSLITATLHPQLEIDDHDNPSLLRLADGRLMVFYCPHAGSPMQYRVTTNADDIRKWEPARIVPQDARFTYPNPFQLPNESNTIYLFWRGTDWKPVYSTSIDGINWSARRTLIDAGAGNTSYVKFVSNGEDAIHFACTESHPELRADNNLYYGYYSKGRIHRANGSVVKTIAQLPVFPSELEKIYDSRGGVEPSWIWDIALDAAGRPVIVYATFLSTAEHRYRYARWTGTTWIHKEMTDAGSSIETAGADPYYSGGIILDHDDPSTVYLSRPATLGLPNEIERWITADLGLTWTKEIITKGSTQKNFRPFVPRNRRPGDLGVIWMQGIYTSYTQYATSLWYAPGPPQVHASGSSPTIDPATAPTHDLGPGEIRGTPGGITYGISRPSHVRLDVYDVAGRHVERLRDASEDAGRHRIAWDTAHLARGVYIVRLETGAHVQSAKILLR